MRTREGHIEMIEMGRLRTGAGAVFHVHAFDAVVAGHRWPGGVEIRDMEMLKGIGHRAHDETVTIPVIANDQDMTVEAFDLADLDEAIASGVLADSKTLIGLLLVRDRLRRP